MPTPTMTPTLAPTFAPPQARDQALTPPRQAKGGVANAEARRRLRFFARSLASSAMGPGGGPLATAGLTVLARRACLPHPTFS